MRSMTGYGRGVAEIDGRRAVVEIRTVNHRFLDIKLRGLQWDVALEEKVTARVRGACDRGSVTITLRLQEHASPAAVQVNLEAARRVHGELLALASALGLEPTVGLELVCAQPGVLVPGEDEPDSAAIWRCVDRALTDALHALLAMRESEGAALARDLRRRAGRLSELFAILGDLARAGPEDARRRLSERLERLLEQSSPGARPAAVDERRLAQEIVLLADRADVTEELVRLASHVAQLEHIMGQGDCAMGRRLEFLVQEIGRELNTVSAKSQSADIASTVVEAKAELEKIREQVHNVE